MRQTFIFLLTFLGMSVPAHAQDQAPLFVEDPLEDQFIYSNIVSVFYHELGHALIDVLNLPVLGREEDAADTLSAILIDDLWEEEASIGLIYDTTYAYQLYDTAEAEAGAELAYADVHGLHMQRYFNYICLYTGANPEGRDDIAQELGLPEDRLAGCADEYQLAVDSWNTLLAGAPAGDGSQPSLVLVSGDAGPAIASVLQGEIDILNEQFRLPVQVAVKVESCGEANAFYMPGEQSITFCTEFVDLWIQLYAANAPQ